jgi:uncharacterized protein YkwD
MAATHAIIRGMRRPIGAAALSVLITLLLSVHPCHRADAFAPTNRDSLGSPSVSAPSSPGGSDAYAYTIQPGDTLWGIAAAHGITLSALVAANNLADPRLLHAGQTIMVPAPRPPDTGTDGMAAETAGGSGSATDDSAESAATPEASLPDSVPASDAETIGPPPEKASWPSELLSLINGKRQAAGLPPLVWSPELALLAQAHAEDCARRNQGSHLGSDGAPLDARITREGLTVRWASENWANAQSTGHAFALWWNEAPGRDPHRRNILDPKYTEIGIGVASGKWGTYFVADFAGR